MSRSIEEFRRFRQEMNQRILDQGNLSINRFFTLDGNVYKQGAVDAVTKEFAGLAASMVLRCDDCIAYHLSRCKELGATNEQLFEIMGVGLIVGGSIVIPHLRRAVAHLDELNDKLQEDRAV